ncbi:MAG: DUF1488 family protein [Burkholderiaceae bacterium]|jgi:hypothetical protein
MDISFPPETLPMLSHSGTLVFIALKDGVRKIPCGISFEALIERFGAKAMDTHALCLAFKGNRSTIHRKASEALALNGGHSVLLMREHF